MSSLPPPPWLEICRTDAEAARRVGAAVDACLALCTS